MQANI